MSNLVVAGFIWGVLSAVSLPFGACIALVRLPGRVAQGMMMAFGAGALINALTLELFGHAYYKIEDDTLRAQARAAGRRRESR
jgi:zinc transporter ZupT